jgi:hypothetical protein
MGEFFTGMYYDAENAAVVAKYLRQSGKIRQGWQTNASPEWKCGR